MVPQSIEFREDVFTEVKFSAAYLYAGSIWCIFHFASSFSWCSILALTDINQIQSFLFLYFPFFPTQPIPVRGKFEGGKNTIHEEKYIDFLYLFCVCLLRLTSSKWKESGTDGLLSISCLCIWWSQMSCMIDDIDKLKCLYWMRSGPWVLSQRFEQIYQQTETTHSCTAPHLFATTALLTITFQLF